VAKPDDIRFAEALPKTRSGKIMRRLLKQIAAGVEIKGDTTTLEDFGVLAKCDPERVACLRSSAALRFPGRCSFAARRNSGPAGRLQFGRAESFFTARLDAGVEAGFVLIAEGRLRIDHGAHFGGDHGEQGEKANCNFRCCLGHGIDICHISIHSIGGANREL
jgi:hypothetical protein